jgi:hypothetical protein
MRRESMKRRRDELRPEYDLTSLKGAVRGKYYERDVATKSASRRTRKATNGRRRATG